MNIKDFAQQILAMNSKQKTDTAIANLKHGLKHEERWNEEHKKQVKALIQFLESGSNDIEDLKSYLTSF